MYHWGRKPYSCATDFKMWKNVHVQVDEIGGSGHAEREACPWVTVSEATGRNIDQGSISILPLRPREHAVDSGKLLNISKPGFFLVWRRAVVKWWCVQSAEAVSTVQLKKCQLPFLPSSVLWQPWQFPASCSHRGSCCGSELLHASSTCSFPCVPVAAAVAGMVHPEQVCGSCRSSPSHQPL